MDNKSRTLLRSNKITNHKVNAFIKHVENALSFKNIFRKFKWKMTSARVKDIFIKLKNVQNIFFNLVKRSNEYAVWLKTKVLIIAIDLPMSSIIGAIRSVTPTKSRDMASRRQAVATIVHRARGGSSSGSTSSSSGPTSTDSILRRLRLRFLRGRWYLPWGSFTFSGPLKVSSSSSSSAMFNAT